MKPLASTLPCLNGRLLVESTDQYFDTVHNLWRTVPYHWIGDLTISHSFDIRSAPTAQPTRPRLTKRQIGARSFFFGDLVTNAQRVSGRAPSWAGMRALFAYATRKAALT